MKINTKFFISLLLVLAGPLANAQVPLGISGGNPDGRNQGRPVDFRTDEVPPNAIRRFDAGDAPLHAQLTSYASEVAVLFGSGHVPLVGKEAEILGVDENEMLAIAEIVKSFHKRTSRRWTEVQTELCKPVLRGDPVGEDYARAAITQLDDSDERNNAIAKELFQEIEQSYGQEVGARLRARVSAHGQSVQHSRMILVEFIPTVLKSDLKTYFVNECNRL